MAGKLLYKLGFLNETIGTEYFSHPGLVQKTILNQVTQAGNRDPVCRQIVRVNVKLGRKGTITVCSQSVKGWQQSRFIEVQRPANDKIGADRHVPLHTEDAACDVLVAAPSCLIFLFLRPVYRRCVQCV